MRIQSVRVRDFRRFTDLTVTDVPEEAKLVVLLGPNGCGKSSLFDAFSFAVDHAKTGGHHYERDYHTKGTDPKPMDWSGQIARIQIVLHETGPLKPNTASPQAQKAFYFRSAYRNEPHFSLNSIARLQDALKDEKHPQRMINVDARVSENYRRIVSETVAAVYSEGDTAVTKGQLRDRIIGDIRASMLRVFGDLMLESPGDPLAHGTFFFTKGTSKDFKYLNLSGGEKAAFDLLLDFVVKRQHFDDTVFCIDEPELHMHSGLQAKLLQELCDLIPEKCQLWLATHSIGMMRKAQQIAQEHPGSVAFLDFSGHDFDAPATLQPITPHREYWRSAFRVALDDLADLVAPRRVVLCEGGRPEMGARRNAEFDAKCLNTVFRTEFPDVLFVSAGGTNDLERNSLLLSGVLCSVVPGVTVTRLYDRDDRSDGEVRELARNGVRVLSMRDIENYLWEDEILTRLCKREGRLDMADQVVGAKRNALAETASHGRPADDVKSATGPAYVEIKKLLGLTQCGNTKEAFCIATLAPLVTPDTQVYDRLKADVFGGQLRDE